MIGVFQILYLVMLLGIVILSLFISYHIIAFSYSNESRSLMLIIFIPVTAVLLLFDFVLFAKVPLEDIFRSVLL